MNVPTERAPRAGSRLLVLWGVSLAVWWGFAFFPTTPGDESWIAIAQLACFGSRPGEPLEAQAWMMLVLAPLMLLGTLLALHGGELRRAWPALSRSRAAWLVTLVLVGVFALESSWAAARFAREARAEAVSFEPSLTEPLPAGFPRGDLPVPAFRLLDQRGETCDEAWFEGEPTVLSFVFAHCKTVCPVLISSVTRAARELGPEGVRVALVTLDPWRDTPAALPELSSRWSLPAGSKVLSGDPGAVCRLLDSLGVARERDLKNGDVSHVPLVMIVDARGRIAYRFNNPPVDWIVEAVRRVRART